MATEARTFEFLQSEFDNHKGAHHEFNLHNANGAFSFDQPLLSAIIDPHNCDQQHLTLDPGTSFVVGFSDVHGLPMKTWGALLDRGLHAESIFKLPMLAVAEPVSWALMVAGLPTIAGFGERLSRFQLRQG